MRRDEAAVVVMMGLKDNDSGRGRWEPWRVVVRSIERGCVDSDVTITCISATSLPVIAGEETLALSLRRLSLVSIRLGCFQNFQNSLTVVTLGYPKNPYKSPLTTAV